MSAADLSLDAASLSADFDYYFSTRGAWPGRDEAFICRAEYAAPCHDDVSRRERASMMPA